MRVHCGILNGKKYISFSDRFNDPLEKYDHLIRHVDKLIFLFPSLEIYEESLYFPPYIHPIKLSKNIKVFVTPLNYPHEIVLAKNVRCLSLGNLCYKPLKLSKNIRHVNLGLVYNRQLSLTKHTSRLIMSSSYNQPLDIGKNLIHLHVGSYFNCPIVLPKNLTQLTFAFDSLFDHRIFLTKNIKLFKPHCSYGSCNDIMVFPMNEFHIPQEFFDVHIYDNLPNGFTDYVKPRYDIQLFNMPSVPRYSRKLKQSKNDHLK